MCNVHWLVLNHINAVLVELVPKEGLALSEALILGWIAGQDGDPSTE